MRDYKSGRWGFSLIWGIDASVFPYALTVALPNGLLTWFLCTLVEPPKQYDEEQEDSAKNAIAILAGFTTVMFFVLQFRSNIAYDRWWEGGTLLQKTRGEWFNAYSSLLAMSSTDPKRSEEVEAFHHMLARLMSLLFSCALQQVSTDKNRPFEILDPDGIARENLEFLDKSNDKVEVILQWIQRSTVQQINTGILPVAPPILSRAFQEVSRGIVNLQNARKIADFPFPFPYAQVSMVMLLIHWCLVPILCLLLFKDGWIEQIISGALAFCLIFFVWSINFIALQLEQPFGSDANDLPMAEMQRDWNASLSCLLARGGQQPPIFAFNGKVHRELTLVMSDGKSASKRRMSTNLANSHDPSALKTMSDVLADTGADLIIGGPQLFQDTKERKSKVITEMNRKWKQQVQEPEPKIASPKLSSPQLSDRSESVEPPTPIRLNPPNTHDVIDPLGDGQWSLFKPKGHMLQFGAAGIREHASELDKDRSEFALEFTAPPGDVLEFVPSASDGKPGHPRGGLRPAMKSRDSKERDSSSNQPGAPSLKLLSFEEQLKHVGRRMKELHSSLIDEELHLLATVGSRFALQVPPD